MAEPESQAGQTWGQISPQTRFARIPSMFSSLWRVRVEQQSLMCHRAQKNMGKAQPGTGEVADARDDPQLCSPHLS